LIAEFPALELIEWRELDENRLDGHERCDRRVVTQISTTSAGL